MPEASRWMSWLRRRPPQQDVPEVVPEKDPPPQPRPEPPPVDGPVDKADPWRPVAGEFALRLLTLTWEAVHHIGEAEFREQDAERRKILFRIDHSVTRVRRLAENLRVLTGEPLDDPDQQITSLHDVTHAAGAAVEHYERLHFGSIADLAVAAVAADDVIRILTELIDNADRYSPPTEPVTIAAHLTGDGDVVIRVEDNGIGLNPAHLPWIERMLADPETPPATELQPAHLGLSVAAVLTRRHRSLRVRLVPRQPRGTIAMLLIGADLLCEAPRASPPTSPSSSASALPDSSSFAGSSGFPESSFPESLFPESEPPGMPPANHHDDVTMVLPLHRPVPMPRRVPASVRGTDPPPPPPTTQVHQTTWHDDAADFNAGVDAARSKAPRHGVDSPHAAPHSSSATPRASSAPQNAEGP
ncbi:sensor histidine kinase [Actinoplanes awajinensis]|nr:ATP-binding protein [Actinoplanes awajinensis]